jgi:hypothetical protein
MEFTEQALAALEMALHDRLAALQKMRLSLSGGIGHNGIATDISRTMRLIDKVSNGG